MCTLCFHVVVFFPSLLIPLCLFIPIRTKHLRMELMRQFDQNAIALLLSGVSKDRVEADIVAQKSKVAVLQDVAAKLQHA